MECKTSIVFKIYAGDYTLKLKKFANSTLDNTATYSFTILKPGIEYHCRFYLSYFHYCYSYHINKAYKIIITNKRKLIEENNLY
jgi:hypothetical protein